MIVTNTEEIVGREMVASFDIFSGSTVRAKHAGRASEIYIYGTAVTVE